MPAPDEHLELTAHEVRTRLIPLVRMTELTGRVTVITEAGRRIAALVPVEAARSREEAHAAAARQQAAASGWQRRLDAVREHVRVQHRRRIHDLEQALARAWQLLDEARPPGTDRAADLLRAEHGSLLSQTDAPPPRSSES
jgi:antitoxin (DNA-binding transcriptional repressor) of toxin-antitoxin stability system